LGYIASVKCLRSIAVIFVAASFSCSGVWAGTHDKSIGMFSKNAVDLWSEISGGDKPLKVWSPDKKSVVLAKFIEGRNDEKVVLQVSGAIGSLEVDLGPGVGCELLWSPDSRAFFVTTSDQGANGSYRLIVVSEVQGALMARDLTPLLARKFGNPVTCGWPERPNVGGISWLGSSKQLLAAAEIVNHSNCDSFGTFKAYVVDVRSMKVVETYGQLATKHRFRGVLGEELQNAPDECVRSPRSCYVSTNHSKD